MGGIILILMLLIIRIYNTIVQNYKNKLYLSRRIDKFSFSDFKINLIYSSWSSIFTDDNINTVFNNFLNSYIRIFTLASLLGNFIVTPISKHG